MKNKAKKKSAKSTGRKRSPFRLYKATTLGVITIAILAIAACGVIIKEKRFKYTEIAVSSSEIFKNNDALKVYVKKFGPKQTIEQLHKLEVDGVGDCHKPAHAAGRFSFELLEGDAFKDFNSFCHSGYTHGVIEAFFKKNGTTDIGGSLGRICKEDFSKFFEHQCIHGIGHGLMAWTGYELIDALDSCDLLSRRVDSCYTGVFMENIIGAVPVGEDPTRPTEQTHVTKYLSDDPHYPCSIVDDKYKGSCYFFQTSRMLKLFNLDFSLVAKECMKAPKDNREKCFSSMGRDVGGLNNDRDFLLSIKGCDKAPSGRYRDLCLEGAVKDTIWDPSGQDTAVGFCKALDKKSEKEICYSAIIVQGIQVFPNRVEQEQYCKKMEEPYQARCINSL